VKMEENPFHIEKKAVQKLQKHEQENTNLEP
jgi:hypothetical protein